MAGRRLSLVFSPRTTARPLRPGCPLNKLIKKHEKSDIVELGDGSLWRKENWSHTDSESCSESNAETEMTTVSSNSGGSKGRSNSTERGSAIARSYDRNNLTQLWPDNTTISRTSARGAGASSESSWSNGTSISTGKTKTKTDTRGTSDTEGTSYSRTRGRAETNAVSDSIGRSRSRASTNGTESGFARGTTHGQSTSQPVANLPTEILVRCWRDDTVALKWAATPSGSTSSLNLGLTLLIHHLFAAWAEKERAMIAARTTGLAAAKARGVTGSENRKPKHLVGKGQTR